MASQSEGRARPRSMNRHSNRGRWCTPAFVLILASAAVGRSTMVSSGFDWENATPESQGMSTAKLDALKDVLESRQTKAFLVIRNDKIVYEWYAPTTEPRSRTTRRRWPRPSSADSRSRCLVRRPADARRQGREVRPRVEATTRARRRSPFAISARTRRGSTMPRPTGCRTTSSRAGRATSGSASSLLAIRSRSPATRRQPSSSRARSCSTATPASPC